MFMAIAACPEFFFFFAVIILRYLLGTSLPYAYSADPCSRQAHSITKTSMKKKKNVD